MNVHVPQPIPVMYRFSPGDFFEITDDKNQVLYEFLGRDDRVVEFRPAANQGPTQTLLNAEFASLVSEGKVDPMLDRNDDARRRSATENSDVEWLRDLSDDAREELIFYKLLCRKVKNRYDDGLTSLTDKALRVAIPIAAAEISMGTRDGSSPVRRISARKVETRFALPSPAKLRDWIRKLEDRDWDEIAIRDHRKGRRGNRPSRIGDAQSLTIMHGWVQAYLDRNRPSMKTLYKLMLGAVDPDEVDRRRVAKGDEPLRRGDLETFAAANAVREAEGLSPLVVPSLSTFERQVRKLPKFDVCLARNGIAAARRRFKIAGRREAALRAGERVALDCWSSQIMALKLPSEFWAALPEELVGKFGKLRLMVCVAICEATKVPLGIRLSVTATADTAIRTLEMVCRDKTAIAVAAGCRSPWNHALTPECVPTDSGSEFIDAGFRCAVRDIGSTNEIGPAGHPDARGCVEAFFRSYDMRALQFFQGRTYSSVESKGDYDVEAFANVFADTLGKAIVRFSVDVHCNSPHAGLGGQTPNDAWIERSKQYGVIPPPSPRVLRAAFGFTDTRRIQNKGVRFLGNWYTSDALRALRRSVGQADIMIRIDLADLGVISVKQTAPKAKWITVPCDIDMKGVGAEDWLATVADLRRRYADAAKIRQPVVLAALRDLRRMGLRSAEDAGIGPSTMTSEEILHNEKLLHRHFEIAPSGVRRDLFAELLSQDKEDVSEVTASEGTTQVVPSGEPSSSDGHAEAPTPVVRRRRGLRPHRDGKV